MDVRPIPSEHDTRVHEVLTYAFMPEKEVDPEDAPEWLDAFHPRALYDVDPGDDAAADDIRAVCGYHDFEVRIRDDYHRVAGIAAVASPPETRRRGHVAELLADVHEELRDDGVAFAVLWPFAYPFYRSLGYGVAGETQRVELPPEALAGVVPEKSGAFRRLSTDDLSAVREVHERWATEALAVRRTDEWWEKRVFTSQWGQDPYVYGWERDDDGDGNGDLRGYVVYRITDPDDADGKRFDVWELAAVDREARDHLLRFCHDHDSQVETVRIQAPSGFDLHASLSDPEAAEVTLSAGAMVRLVDVAAGLESLSYPAAAETVTLAVEDDHCPWNDARFTLSVADGRARVERTPDAPADATLPVEALSRLAVGARGAAELAADRVLDGDDETVEKLDAVFPHERVYLREGF